MQIVNNFVYLTSITCTTVRSPPWSSCTEQATVYVPALEKVYSHWVAKSDSGVRWYRLIYHRPVGRFRNWFTLGAGCLKPGFFGNLNLPVTSFSSTNIVFEPR